MGVGDVSDSAPMVSTATATAANNENNDNDNNNKTTTNQRGNVDLEGKVRLKEKGLTTMEKLEILLELSRECPHHDADGLPTTTGLSNKGRSFHRQLRPMLRCFVKHCESNKETFCARWPTLKHTTFACKGDPCVALAPVSGEQKQK